MGKDADGCCESCKRFGEEPAVPDTAAPMRAAYEDVSIVVLKHGQPYSIVKPTSEHVRVGRVAGNDVVLASGDISKRQCELLFRDGDIFVRDMKSACGTVVGGRKIMGPTPLTDDGLIFVGDYQLRVVRGR